MIRINKSALQLAYDAADTYIKKVCDVMPPEAMVNNTALHAAYVAGRIEAVADYDQMIEHSNKLAEENMELKAKLKRYEDDKANG